MASVRSSDDFSEIFAKTAGGIKPGLSRMRAALHQLDQPHSSGRNVLVAGTNGKGTTSSFLWYLSQLDGDAVSLFSSPHLVQFKERFLYSKARLSHDTLKQCLAQLRQRLGALYEPLSFFEVATLLGFSLFDTLGAKERIWEVGLGGRWDCTNCAEPELSIIVSIGLDHQEFLGDTLKQVLTEKLGVSRPGKPLLLGNCPNLQDEALLELCLKTGAHVLRFGEHYGYEKSGYEDENENEAQRAFIALPGQPREVFALPEPLLTKPRYLRDNFILACAAFWCKERWLSNQRSDQAPQPPFTATLARIVWPHLWGLPGFFGRGQRMTVEGQPLLWDVCHNPAGARAFVQGLKGPHEAKFPGLISILADKDIAAITTELRRVLDIKAFYRIDHPRSPSRSQLQNLLPGVLVFDSFAEAWNSKGSWLAGGDACSHQPLVMCGSVMAVGVAMAHLADVSVEIDKLWHFDRFITPDPHAQSALDRLR